MFKRVVVESPGYSGPPALEEFAPKTLMDAIRREQGAVPSAAKDQKLTSELERLIKQVPTSHELILQDSRQMDEVPDASVHLVVTSPPYWTLKEYPEREGQLGALEEYNFFLEELDKVWEHCFRVLVPGGRLVVVVGDVCLSRKRNGRHVVFPLHASIQEHCREIGFDNLSTIIWYKISNAKFEVKGGSGFLGKPYEPNAVLKNDIEFILSQRKAGEYRKPSVAARALSLIPEKYYREWFKQIWTLGGASTRSHPAPYPLAVAERLIRMFSFVGDTVLDPFMGTGTTNLAAAHWGRNSIGFDVEPKYFGMAKARLEEINQLHLKIRA